jgi:hypothetical protein
MIGKARRWGSALLLALAIVPGAAAATYKSPPTDYSWTSLR